MPRWETAVPKGRWNQQELSQGVPTMKLHLYQEQRMDKKNGFPESA